MVPISYNFRSLVVRKTTTIAAASGIALVVFVIASTLMLLHGVKQTMGAGGKRDNVVVMRKGADTEMSSSIEEPQIGLILAIPGVKKNEAGAGMGVGEVVVVVTQEKIGTEGGVSNVQIRGVPDNVMKFRPEVKIVEGRPAQPGTDEVIVGKRIRGRFKGVDLGGSFELKKNRTVKVVGVFEAAGSAHESEVWGDLDVVRQSFGREGMVSSVRARLASPAALDTFRLAVEQDKQLGLQVEREDVFYEKQSQGTSTFLGAIGIMIAVFFSMGAMIGATITMYAAVANRQREIGILRALGFTRLAILGSFLTESILLALAGSVVGAFGSLGMGFVKISILNFQSWSEIVLAFTPTPAILGKAMLLGGIMGVIGGFLPAIRAARVSPVAAMRG